MSTAVNLAIQSTSPPVDPLVITAPDGTRILTLHSDGRLSILPQREAEAAKIFVDEVIRLIRLIAPPSVPTTKDYSQWSHGDGHAAMRSGGWNESIGDGVGPDHDISECGG